MVKKTAAKKRATKKRKPKPVEIPALPPLDKAAIIALDLGRRTGWAYQARDGKRDSGVHELYDTNGILKTYKDGLRFAHLRNFVRTLDAQLGGADIIAFEEVNPATHCSKRQTTLYGGFRGELMCWAELHSKLVVPVPVGTWKRHFCSNGNAKKHDVIAECVKRGHLPFADTDNLAIEHDDNEADALGVLCSLWPIAAEQQASNVIPFRPAKTKRKAPTKARKSRVAA